MSRQYCTIEEIENYMSVEIEASFEAQVLEWVEWMTEYIETVTERVFEADAANSEKIYEVTLGRMTDVAGTSSGSRELVVNEFVNTSTSSMKLTMDDVELDEDQFLLYPATVEELPKVRLVFKKDTGLVFTEGEQNIKVEAKWGYSIDVPDQIKFAVIVLVAGMINNSWSSEGEMKSVTIGRYKMQFKDKKELQDFDRVQDILKTYSKPIV